MPHNKSPQNLPPNRAANRSVDLDNVLMDKRLWHIHLLHINYCQSVGLLKHDVVPGSLTLTLKKWGSVFVDRMSSEIRQAGTAKRSGNLAGPCGTAFILTTIIEAFHPGWNDPHDNPFTAKAASSMPHNTLHGMWTGLHTIKGPS